MCSARWSLTHTPAWRTRPVQICLPAYTLSVRGIGKSTAGVSGPGFTPAAEHVAASCVAQHGPRARCCVNPARSPITTMAATRLLSLCRHLRRHLTHALPCATRLTHHSITFTLGDATACSRMPTVISLTHSDLAHAVSLTLGRSLTHRALLTRGVSLTHGVLVSTHLGTLATTPLTHGVASTHGGALTPCTTQTRTTTLGISVPTRGSGASIPPSSPGTRSQHPSPRPRKARPNPPGRDPPQGGKLPPLVPAGGYPTARTGSLHVPRAHPHRPPLTPCVCVCASLTLSNSPSISCVSVDLLVSVVPSCLLVSASFWRLSHIFTLVNLAFSLSHSRPSLCFTPCSFTISAYLILAFSLNCSILSLPIPFTSSLISLVHVSVTPISFSLSVTVTLLTQHVPRIILSLPASTAGLTAVALPSSLFAPTRGIAILISTVVAFMPTCVFVSIFVFISFICCVFTVIACRILSSALGSTRIGGIWRRGEGEVSYAAAAAAPISGSGFSWGSSCSCTTNISCSGFSSWAMDSTHSTSIPNTPGSRSP
uniref:Uncharacterized protein n=1 Tax=Eptatretus burgeri TaxID=7764 RepID=A0A8C4Q5N8_EPTBU